jgi:hypothetical protein
MKDSWVKWAGGRWPSADKELRIERMRVESNGRKRGRKMTVEREKNDGRGGVLWRTSRSIPCSSVAQKLYARPGLPRRGALIF